jgi:hypothetical protein
MFDEQPRRPGQFAARGFFCTGISTGLSLARRIYQAQHSKTVCYDPSGSSV